MKTTRQSEFGKIKSVVLKKASDAFVSEATITGQWRNVGFLEKPDFLKATAEFESFEKILRNNGTTFHHLPKKEDVTIDSLYCRDASVATDRGMILCNMGKRSRMHEPDAQRRLFEQLQVSILARIENPATLEGGDCAWVDENTLAIGESYRTNPEGITQVKQLLEPNGIEVLVVPLPHYKGPEDVFHLMSVFSPVDRNLAVVYSPLLPISFRNELTRRGFELVEVPDNEFDSMACNVLAAAPRECIMIKGNPETKGRLERSGCAVFEYEGREISLKGGGGPTCLTRPIDRIV